MVDNTEISYTGDGVNPNSLLRYKIVFVGDIAVGKTSIIYRLLENKFKENYEPSIGVDFCSKSIRYKGKNIKLQIWDSAGQERYKSLIPNYVRGSSIIFIVYDVSSNKI
jgi:small GTP-binding protein